VFKEQQTEIKPEAMECRMRLENRLTDHLSVLFRTKRKLPDARWWEENKLVAAYFIYDIKVSL